MDVYDNVAALAVHGGLAHVPLKAVKDVLSIILQLQAAAVADSGLCDHSSIRSVELKRGKSAGSVSFFFDDDETSTSGILEGTYLSNSCDCGARLQFRVSLANTSRGSCEHGFQRCLRGCRM
jgi:hypothetical protein